MSRSTNRNANRMSSAAENLSQTVGDAVRELPDNLRSVNREFAARAAKGIDQAGDAASRYLHQGRENMEHLEHMVEDHVRSQPWQALLLAFGIGAMFAYMTRPRSE